MTNTSWESFKAEGATIVEKVKALIHEGNVRRVVVEHEGRTIAEFPLTAGVVGAVLAPVVAAIAAVVALFKDCTIHVARVSPETGAAGRERSPQSPEESGRAV
jgi:hypothetical protein